MLNDQLGRPPCDPTTRDMPRHPHQEIADLLATALLRLHGSSGQSLERNSSAPVEEVCLGFIDGQSVNANPSQRKGKFA